MNNPPVTVSVPGKVHLMGEHAVVHGKPALVAAIDRRLTVVVSEGTGGVTVESSMDDGYVGEIVGIVASHLGITMPSLHVKITSDLLPGYHLGSSAAVAVAVAGACLYFLKRIWNPQLANKLAYEAEKLKHGKPSGSDNTAVTMGGFIWYRKELEFLKSIWQVPFAVPPHLNHFRLIDTGKPEESTGDLVAYVTERIRKHPAALEVALDANENATRRMATALKTGNETEVLASMHGGERTLETMGVVSPLARKLIRAIEATGGAAKILGGGGQRKAVGYVLAYHSRTGVLEDVCGQFGYGCESVALGGEGTRLESKHVPAYNT